MTSVSNNFNAYRPIDNIKLLCFIIIKGNSAVIQHSYNCSIAFCNLLLNVGHHFRLIVLYAMPEVTTFWEEYAIRFTPYLQYQAKLG